jgi:uncharacterized Zn finger protein (UPF0148 family)
MSEAGGARIKSAAAALLKGGTLVSEPCAKCGGVQVMIADKVSCVNCGNESVPAQKEVSQKPSSLNDSLKVIEDKVSALVQELKDEKDTAVQRQKAELLETYLRILEKMRALSK